MDESLPSLKTVRRRRRRRVCGVISARMVYTEDELCRVLEITPVQMLDYYQQGLPYFQVNRKGVRQIAGSEYHRFIVKHSRVLK